MPVPDHRPARSGDPRSHPSPPDAIETACRVIDDGYDVFGIGTGPLTDSIERDQIVRIYALWARTRYPLGLIPAGKP